MAQPKTSPLSVRCKAPLRALIDAAALAQGAKANALVVRWIEEGLARDAGPAPPKAQVKVDNPAPVAPKAILAQAEAKAAHLAKPAPKRRHPRWAMAMQVGATRPPPGSRLKGPKSKAAKP